MKILITGASGMVGRNIQDLPAFSQYELLTPSSSELNLLQEEPTMAYLKKHKPELVIHTAALVGGIQANIKHPVDFLIKNLEMNKNIFMSAREADVKKFLYLGSSCMYPRNAPNPLKEELVLQGELEPTNEGYAIAKIMGQRLGQYMHQEDPSFVAKTLIPSNLYGKYDKFDPKHSHLIPAIIYKVYKAKVENKPEVDIWGDGTARREFMYAGDLAECIFAAVKRFDELPDSMNVGLGHDYTINEYYEAAAEVMSYKGKFVHDLSKPVGMKRKLMDVSLCTKWGWQSKTSLKEGIAKSYEYFLSISNN